MSLSKAQNLAYWRLWKSACETQGWTREKGFDSAAVNAKRKECLSEIGFESMKDLDGGAGFTAWKNLCLRLCGDLDGAIEEVRSERQPRTKSDRFRWVIRNVMIPCLALYPPPTCSDPHLWATDYLNSILRNALPWRETGAGIGVPVTLDDCDEFTLKKLISTLNSRISSKRRDAGHSLHQMHIAAGVRCTCAACKKSALEKTLQTQPF